MAEKLHLLETINLSILDFKLLLTEFLEKKPKPINLSILDFKLVNQVRIPRLRFL